MVLCLKQTGALVFEPSGALPLLVEIVLCKSSRGKKGVLQPRSPLLCGEALGTVTALAREATLTPHLHLGFSCRGWVELCC